jgi:hypothetical protein
MMVGWQFQLSKIDALSCIRGAISPRHTAAALFRVSEEENLGCASLTS